MNKEFVLYNLNESMQQLTSTFHELEVDQDFEYGDYISSWLDGDSDIKTVHEQIFIFYPDGGVSNIGYFGDGQISYDDTLKECQYRYLSP